MKNYFDALDRLCESGQPSKSEAISALQGKFPELSAVQYGQTGIHARFFVNYRICLYHCCYAPCLSLLLPAACFQRMPAPLSKFLVSYNGRPITPECEPIIFLTKPASSPSIL